MAAQGVFLKASSAKATLSQAYHEAIRCLARRDHCRAEISQRLAHKGFLPETVEAVLAKLTDQGLVDDRKFACNWVASRVRRAPRSRRLLAFELRRKGFDAVTVECALTDLDDRLLALACIERRQRQWQGIPSIDEQRIKILRHLQNKGFSLAVSHEAMRRYLAGEAP